jgi:hypothetical protein
MMSVRVRYALAIVLTAALLLIALLCACAVSAQSGPVQLSVTPDTLELSPGEKATVLIVASLPATATDSLRPLTITLTSFTGTGVNARLLSDAKRPAPPPGGAISWLAEVAAPESGVSAGKLYLAAMTEGRADNQPLTRTAVASVGIADRPAEAITDVLSATLHSDIETLLDLRQRDAILVLANISTVPVTVTNVVPTLTSTQSKQLKAEVSTELPITLLPQQAIEIPVRLIVGSSIESGKNLLVVRADANWMRGKLARQGSRIVTQAFQSGVFGESAILTAVGIPALILLPGLLMVVGFVLFYRAFHPKPASAPPPAGKPKPDDKSHPAGEGKAAGKPKPAEEPEPAAEPEPAGEPKPDPNTPEPSWWALRADAALAKPQVWFWAIGFSLCLFLTYPWISGWFLSWMAGEKQAGRNLLTGYGFIDIVYLWIVSALAGLLFAAIATWAPPAARRLWALWPQRYTPTSRDDEKDVLVKLVRNRNQDFTVETYKVEGQLVCRLPEAIHVPGKAWVTPRIRVVREPGAPAGFADEFQGVDKTIRAGNSEAGLKRLRQWEKEGRLKLAFDPAGPLKRPALVDEAALQPSGQERQPILSTNAAY